MTKMDDKMDLTYAVNWNVPIVLHLILQTDTYDGRKIHELFIKVDAQIQEDYFKFCLLISTWNTQCFKDLLLSHCYLQFFYFT